MAAGMGSYEKSLAVELAEAISSFNIGRVSGLLSEDGRFYVQDENKMLILSDKKGFIEWLNGCYRTFLSSVKFRQKLTYNIVQSLNSLAANPVIIFEDGTFPVLTAGRDQHEKIGFIVISEKGNIKGMEFCLLIMKSEFPFIYEKRALKPDI